MNTQPKYNVVIHSSLDRQNTVDASLAGCVADVLAGKVSTSDFFNNFNGLQSVMRGIANSSSSWQVGTADSSGNPSYRLLVGKYKVTVKCKKYAANFNADGSPRSAEGPDDLHKFKWEGKEYAIAGLAECSISDGSTHLFWNSAHAGMSVENWGKLVFDIGFLDVMATILKNACRRLVAGFMHVAIAPLAGGGGANAIANGAAEDLLVEEEISVYSAATCYIGLAIIAIGVTLALLEHPTYHNLKLYNLTTSDVTWNLKFLHDGTEVNSQPSNDGVTPTYELKGAMQPQPDDDFIPDPTEFIYSEGNFQFKNGHSFRGIYYVMTLAIKSTTSTDIENLSFLFCIPFSGNNSLFASFETLADKHAAEKYYDMHASKSKTLLFVADGSKYSLSLTFDYLSGKHKMPPENKEQYYYQSLAVLRPAA